ncbi:MAG: hypothetical protein AB1592_05705 [Pseudomonadota bacterium]
MKPGRTALLMAAVLAGAAPLPVGAQAPQLPPLACSGPFAKDADAARLAAVFGAANVRHGDVTVAEGATEPGTILFPDDSARRLEILWHDAEARKRPSLVRAGEGSVWRAPVPRGVLSIGLPIAEVEAINGRPFTLYGFEWDYGGYVSDWKGGALGMAREGCVIGARFAPDPNAPDTALIKVAGDRQMSSALPAMRAVRPSVQQISIAWPE